MKNKILLLSSLLAGCALFFAACDKSVDSDSTPHQTSQPFIVESFLGDFIYAAGSTTIYGDIPDTVAVAVDSVYGFQGGFGGKTGSDTIYLLKSDILGFGDTISVGGSNFVVEKYNKGNYRVQLSTNVVIAGANDSPGPTALEGSYQRILPDGSNGLVINLAKVANGVYLILNPGGGGVGPQPYLLYNYANTAGLDSLSFPIQTDLCGGGLQLVAPAAPAGLTSADYTADYQPQITSLSPVTLKWKVFEFPSATDAAVHPGAALCNWGLAVRTFVKI